MSDLNQTVEFIKKIEKLKSQCLIELFDGRFKIVLSIPGRCDSCDGSARLLSRKIEYGKIMFLLLIHDLGEVYAGDTWVFDTKASFSRIELASIKTMSSFR